MYFQSRYHVCFVSIHFECPLLSRDLVDKMQNDVARLRDSPACKHDCNDNCQLVDDAAHSAPSLLC